MIKVFESPQSRIPTSRNIADAIVRKFMRPASDLIAQSQIKLKPIEESGSLESDSLPEIDEYKLFELKHPDAFVILEEIFDEFGTNLDHLGDKFAPHNTQFKEFLNLEGSRAQIVTELQSTEEFGPNASLSKFTLFAAINLTYQERDSRKQTMKLGVQLAIAKILNFA